MNKLNVTGPTALVRTQGRVEPWRNADWQRLWLASQLPGRPWRSLALVPAGPGTVRELTLQVAVGLAHTGMTHLSIPIHVADATRVTLQQLVPFLDEVRAYTEDAGMILVALPPVDESVTSVSLAQAADCALLCVQLGHMSTSDAKKTVERIGHQRFIGSAVFRAKSA